VNVNESRSENLELLLELHLSAKLVRLRCILSASASDMLVRVSVSEATQSLQSWNASVGFSELLFCRLLPEVDE